MLSSLLNHCTVVCKLTTCIRTKQGRPRHRLFYIHISTSALNSIPDSDGCQEQDGGDVIEEGGHDGGEETQQCDQRPRLALG